MGAAGRECSFMSRVGPRQQDSDVEDIEADRSCQVPVSESSPEQSYGLERDFTECESDDFRNHLAEIDELATKTQQKTVPERF